MVDGKILPPIWLNKDPVTKKVSMNGPRYKKELEEKVFCHFTQQQLDENDYWWMQGICILGFLIFLKDILHYIYILSETIKFSKMQISPPI